MSMGHHILVVEDSPTMRQLLHFTLKRLKGVEVLEAGDGVEGYKVLTSNKVDLIVADLNMPVMDGLKMISMIKGNPAYREIPIVVVTTEGGEEDRKKAMALGANAYITKPIQTSQLLSVVKGLLNIG